MSKAYNRSVGYRSKKRRFHGRKSENSSDIFTGKSASSKKLKLDISSAPENSNSCELTGYRLIDIAVFFKEISKYVSCNICHTSVNFTEESIRGNASVFSVNCENCNLNNKINSCPMIGPKHNVPEVNIRLVYSLRSIGQGLAGLRTLCSLMNMPPPISQKSYDTITNKLKVASKKAAVKSMKEAAEEEITLSGDSNICISGDGTWKTRGHTSKIGVCSVIGIESGKVIDVEVLSSYCKACETSSSSSHDCKTNHSGSSGSMEVIGMKRIFLRSEVTRSVKYQKYLGDGDTKTFLELTKAEPYKELKIEKLECIGHVQKRMGSRLRKLKQTLRGVKLSDGKALGGKGRLTDGLINKLTVYYGNAIRSNTHCLESMRAAVWATYCHMCSTDEEPMHMFCPKGIDSWCKYQRHVSSPNTTAPFRHKPSVPLEVMKKIKCIYADLAAPNLLKRCLSGKTQNQNESFNSVIWKFCPKVSGAGFTVAELATYEAVIAFNDGSSGRLTTLEELGINPGTYTVEAAKSSDLKRVRVAEKRADFSSLEARRARSLKEKIKFDKLELKEGTTYDPGAF